MKKKAKKRHRKKSKDVEDKKLKKGGGEKVDAAGCHDGKSQPLQSSLICATGQGSFSFKLCLFWTQVILSEYG